MLRFGRFIQIFASIVAVAGLSVSPTIAASATGTHAWSTDTLTLHNGPGTQYAVTGSIVADSAIRVLRCQKLWCNVDGASGRGWTYKRNINFGLSSEQWPGGVHPNYPSGGLGTACFYTGANYTGTSVCVGGGRVINDLALLGLDNAFASVKLNGKISVAVCRDRSFQSYCERLVESKPTLNRYLSRNLSSIRVY